MVWVAELKSDSASKAVVRAMRSAERASRNGDDARGDVGVLVCSTACHIPDVCERVRELAEGNAQIIVVHLSRCANPWRELEAGALDVLHWDGKPDYVFDKLARISEIDEFIRSPAITESIVGGSTALRLALRDLITAARFGAGPILILGETGTGKELAAGIAHRADPNCCNGPMVVVDCTTIVPGLLGSELFGHERGAFTGAVSARSGACSAANGGCLFLDEVGELPLELQPEFMRVVQEGTYKHVGGDRWNHSSFRLVCATNRDLAHDVQVGRFRSDLYYRIAASTIHLPALRERGEDVLALFQHFYHQASGTRHAINVDPALRVALTLRAYPGNLRDLRQLAHRVAARHVGEGPLTPGDLPHGDRPIDDGSDQLEDRTEHRTGLAEAIRRAVDSGITLRQLRDDVTDKAIDAAIDAAGGNIRAAAARLGITDRAVHQRRARAKATITV